jgi:geranylgeranyl pyrophosphate synthase
MTFQIIDDLLDFQGDPRNLGKPVLSDLNEGRITLPLIYAMSNDGQPDCRRLRGLLKNRSLAEESKQEILAILRGTGALEYTFRRAEEFSRRSRDVIGQFPASPHREALQVLAEFVLKRDQ